MKPGFGQSPGDNVSMTAGRIEEFVIGILNHRSRRAVEKIGASELPGASPTGSVTYRLTRASWLGSAEDIAR